MELRVLRYFLTVAGEETITRAAELLHLTQPTLSRQLAQLEEEVGAKLFVRGTRRLTLTEEGLLLLRRAREIVELVDKAEQELKCHEETLEGLVSLGCGEMAAVELLPDLIRHFQQRYPNISFDLYTATAEIIKERMEQGLTDVGLLLEPVDLNRLDFFRLPVTEPWVVVMRPQDPLGEKEAITPQDLRGNPLLLPRRTQVQGELISWLGEAYSPAQARITGNLATNIHLMVYHGLGYALSMRGALPYWDENKLIYRPLSPPLSATCVMAWKKQQPHSVATTRFLQCARDYFAHPPEERDRKEA